MKMDHKSWLKTGMPSERYKYFDKGKKVVPEKSRTRGKKRKRNNLAFSRIALKPSMDAPSDETIHIPVRRIEDRDRAVPL